MTINVCIIGYGSIGKRHYEILLSYFKKNQIYIITKQEKIFNSYKNINALKFILPKYVIICNETSKHYRTINYIERNFSNMMILVEKPLFANFSRFKPKKNSFYVGYNMRFNPIIKYLKKYLKNKKIYSVNVICGSYLPDWRPKRDYKTIYSSIKKLGGGVLLDLSHELDYVKWIFGDYKLKYSFSKKISDLKINTEDHADLMLKTDKNIHINISLNYYSRKSIRNIVVNGFNFSLFVNLIEKEIEFNSNKISRTKKFSFDRNQSYFFQIKSFLTNRFNLCTYDEALFLLKKIDEIKKFK